MLGKLTFCIIVCNSIKEEKKTISMQKPKKNLKVHNLINSESPRPWKLQNSLGVLIPLSHKTGFQLRPFLHNLLQKSFFRCGFQPSKTNKKI